MKVDKEITEEYGKGPRVTYILSDKRALTTKNQKSSKNLEQLKKDSGDINVLIVDVICGRLIVGRMRVSKDMVVLGIQFGLNY